MKNRLILLLFLISISACCSTFPVAKVTVKVLDESGNPIEAVKVSISFQVSKGKEQGIKDVTEEGITGTDGVFSASHKTFDHIAFGAEKKGYYKSYGEYHFSTRANDRWQPWNPEFKLVLRKIENPVPMYARHSRMSPITVPELRKEIGFDLIEFDWVSPHGKGKHSDLRFKLTSTYNSEVDFDTKLELTFPNKFDGIQLVKEDRTVGSDLKLPRMAPESGYSNKLIRSRSRAPETPGEDDQKEDNNYIFRIRSEEKNGKLVRAMYGKIQGDIFIHPPTSIYFKYYLNPDYTRNLEFDPNKNLFKGLSSLEDVGLD